MKGYICSLALTICILSGCAASVISTSDAQFVSSGFEMDLIEREGLALLPVTGVQQSARSLVGFSVDTLFWSRLATLNYLDHVSVNRRLADHNLIELFQRMTTAYDQTGLLDTNALQQIGEATGKRFLLRIIIGSMESDRVAGTTTNLRTGKSTVTSYDEKSTRLFAQILDVKSGEVVWEGSGSAEARASQYFYIKDGEAAFFTAASLGLINGLTGRQALWDRITGIELVSAGDELREYQNTYNGVAYDLQPCQEKNRSCFSFELYEELPSTSENEFAGRILKGVINKPYIFSAERDLKSWIDVYHIDRNNISDTITE